MSLILEALRKSEAERRRAQAPDLFAEPSPTKARAMATSPRWLAWALAAIVALLLTGWLARGLLDATPHTVAVDTKPSRTVVEQPSHVASVESPSLAAAGVAPTSAPKPTPTAIDPNPPALPVPARATLTSDIEQPPTASEVRARTIPSVPEPSERVVATSEPEPASAPVSASSTPSSEVTLRLADLSSEERRQLPTLKMSMHLWHAVSAQRFVILDGERMGEGDRIGDAVIDEITRDGVLLAWQGRRLKLPIQ